MDGGCKAYSHIRFNNGLEFIVSAVRTWIAAVDVKTAVAEPGSLWENGFCKSFNSMLRDELLHGEIFTSLAEAKVVIEDWRRYTNTKRLHSSLDFRSQAPEVVQWPPPPPPGAAPPATRAVAPRRALHQD